MCSFSSVLYHVINCEFKSPPLMVRCTRSWWGVLTHGEVYSMQHYVIKFVWIVTGRWFSHGTLVSSTNKTDHHDITEILLKVALKTITPPSRREIHYVGLMIDLMSYLPWLLILFYVIRYFLYRTCQISILLNFINNNTFRVSDKAGYSKQII